MSLVIDILAQTKTEQRVVASPYPAITREMQHSIPIQFFSNDLLKEKESDEHDESTYVTDNWTF